MQETTLEDFLGIEQTKLGYFQEWQKQLLALHAAHGESERQRQANAAILDSIPDMMMVLDDALCIRAVNSVFEAFFPGRNGIGQSCYSFFYNASVPCPKCPAVLSLQHGTINRETAIFPHNGENLHFDMVASPLPATAVNTSGVVVFKRNVTHEKRIQAQMYQAEKMISVGMLAAGVAHEINNPLTAVSGFAEGIRRRMPLLAEHAPPEVVADIAEYTNTILQECARCRDIVAALVNFSRPLPSRTPTSLVTIIEETLSLLRHTLKQYARIVFCLDLEPNLPDVWVDDTQIRQLLLNLITNALDALFPADGAVAKSAEGTITIATWQEDDHVILQVKDTGAGISPEHMATIFEPFFTTKAKGLGLGLSVCYSIVQAHGGEIALTADAHGATCATVCLPVQGEFLPAAKG